VSGSESNNSKDFLWNPLQINMGNVSQVVLTYFLLRKYYNNLEDGFRYFIRAMFYLEPQISMLSQGLYLDS
jgi:hypothetical protein